MSSIFDTALLTLAFFISVKEQAFQVDGPVQKDGENPILIIVPGLTSASDSAVSSIGHSTMLSVSYLANIVYSYYWYGNFI